MATEFYDKVAAKFGKYDSGVDYEKVFFNGDPEAVFRRELYKVSGRTKSALDTGCADGRFTLLVSPIFKDITAIDVSDRMLAVARKFQKLIKNTNIHFENIDLHDNGLNSESFDVVYCRRGPTDYKEFARLLKPYGSYVEIRIGEQDAKELKEVFGRGQGYGEWDEPTLKKVSLDMMSEGFDIQLAQDFWYKEYYKTSADLSRFLESVPIFEDFDPEADRSHLADYIATHKTGKGVFLSRHRVVFVAQRD